jgi:hypothetical protein
MNPCQYVDGVTQHRLEQLQMQGVKVHRVRMQHMVQTGSRGKTMGMLPVLSKGWMRLRKACGALVFCDIAFSSLGDVCHRDRTHVVGLKSARACTIAPC